VSTWLTIAGTEVPVQEMAIEAPREIGGRTESTVQRSGVTGLRRVWLLTTPPLTKAERIALRAALIAAPPLVAAGTPIGDEPILCSVSPLGGAFFHGAAGLAEVRYRVREREGLASISATPAVWYLLAGETKQVTVSALSDSGQSVTPPATYGTSSGAIATVSASGLVTGVAAGTATITTTVGSLNDTTSVVVGAAFTDFSEHTSGAQPTGFTETWATTVGGFTTTTDGAATGGKRLAWAYASGSGPDALLWTAVGQGGAYETTGRYRFATSGLAVWGGAVLGASVSASQNGLRLEIRNNGSAYLFDGASQKDVEALGLSAGTWIYYRFRAETGGFKAKVWTGAVGAEPASWTLEGLYNTTRPSGYAGVYVEGSSGTSADFDILGVNVGGGTAPIVAGG
jgi:hypothetical protein